MRVNCANAAKFTESQTEGTLVRRFTGLTGEIYFPIEILDLRCKAQLKQIQAVKRRKPRWNIKITAA